MKALLRTGCLLLSLVLAACSSTSKKADEPAELTDFKPTITIDKLWSSSIGDGQGNTLTYLQPAIAGDRLYVASVDGRVEARDLQTGKRYWKQSVDAVVKAGVGVDASRLYLVTLAGELVSLDVQTGAFGWVTELGSEVLAPPVSDGERVYVQTVDGKIVAVGAQRGERLWSYDSQLPVLTQWGTGSVVLAGQQLLAGLPGGKLVSLDPATGQMQWEGRVAVPQGRSEIDRLVDVDGDPLVSGGHVYAVSFQGNLAAFDLASGRMEWRQPASSHVGLSEGFDHLYAVEANGTVRAYNQDQADIAWEQPALAWRGLTAAVPLSSYLLVADKLGYVHVLSQADGSFAARFRVDSDGIAVAPVVSGDVAVVYANSGDLYVFRLEPRH